MSSVINVTWREHFVFVDEPDQTGLREVQISGPELSTDYKDTDASDQVCLQTAFDRIDQAIYKGGKFAAYPRPTPTWEGVPND